jgi:hypothetical protein
MASTCPPHARIVGEQNQRQTAEAIAQTGRGTGRQIVFAEDDVDTGEVDGDESIPDRRCDRKETPFQ